MQTSHHHNVLWTVRTRTNPIPLVRYRKELYIFAVDCMKDFLWLFLRLADRKCYQTLSVCFTRGMVFQKSASPLEANFYPVPLMRNINPLEIKLARRL